MTILEWIHLNNLFFSKLIMVKYTFIPEQQENLTKEELKLIIDHLRHDLNNVFTALIGHSDLLYMDIRRKKVLTQEKDLPKIKRVNIYAKHCHYITNAAINLASNNVGEGSNITRLFCDMSLTTRNNKKTDLLEQRIITEDKNLEINRGKNLIYLQLYNHLTNAVDSLEKKRGKITLSAQELLLPNYLITELAKKEYFCLPQQKFIKISITDTGHGIPEKCIEKIYQPGISKKGSTGVGLALTDLICRKLDGFEVVESKINQGTTFELYIPKESKLASP